MRNLLLSIGRALMYVFAVCVITAATIVSIVDLLTPVLDKHRADFEKWASEQLSVPVTIDKVRVSWYQYQPEIYLTQVAVLGADKKPVLQIKKVRIFLSIPQSLWQRQPVTSGLMLSGSEIKLHQNKDGAITLQGFPSLGEFKAAPSQDELKLPDTMMWLSAQPSLILEDIDVFYEGYKNDNRYVTLYKLGFVNTADQHTIQGKAILHQDVPTEATVSVDWFGETNDLSKIRAKMYLYVSGFSLSQWLKGYDLHGWQVKDGMISAKIWAVWNQGQFRKIQTMVQAYGLKVYSSQDKITHAINRLSGNLGWKREGANQIFAGEDVLVDLPSHLWPASNFYVLLTPDATNTLQLKALNVGYVDIHDVQSFLPASMLQPVLPLHLKGDIENASFAFNGAWNDLSKMTLNVNVNRVGITAWKQWPGIENASGVVKWDGTQGSVTLNSKQTEFKLDSVFAKPIKLDELTGELQWAWATDKSLILTGQDLHVVNEDVTGAANGTLKMPVNGSPVIDLKADFSLQNASHVTTYLPMKIFEKDLVGWLQGAFLSGSAQSGHAELRGALKDFPFDKNNGLFLITGDVDNVDLRYAPDWPILKNTSGTLTFAGRRMSVDVDHTEVSGIAVGKVRGEMLNMGDDSKPQLLTIQADPVATDFVNGLAFVHASPLEKTFGKMFTDAEMKGPITLTLGLTIPFENPDNTQVSGDIAFKDTTLNLVPWHLLINDLQGSLHFTEKVTQAKGIQGNWFGKPVTIGLSTVQKSPKVSVVQATFANQIAMSDLETWLKVPVTSVAQGSTAVTGKIDFAADAPIVISLKSQLVGVALTLPDRYGKTAAVSRALTADIYVQEKQPLKIQTSYGGLLGAAVVLDYKNDKFKLVGCNLSLGAGVANWPEGPGLYLSGSLNSLSWDDIKNYINQSSSTKLPVDLPLRGIDLKFKSLNVFGQVLTQPHVQLTPEEDGWVVDVTSPQITGRIYTPLTMSPKGTITAQLQQLNLTTSKGPNQASPMFEVKSLPAISFTANRVKFDDMVFGKVNFKTVPTSNGLSIQTLTISSPSLNLMASGDWTRSGNSYATRIRGYANSSNVSRLLESLGFNAQNFIASTGKFNFDLSWDDAPFAPGPGKMSGNASLDIGKGRIVELGQGSDAKMDLGRMLNIFSLQSIPRRLSLDFSDVFQKGYSFDYLRGDFNFDGGDLYTTNTRIDGPVARVEIAGRIGLVEKDYDLTLSVTPYVTSSIPVAATLFTMNPVVGLAALGVNTVISPAVSKATTYHYVVRGPWNNPSWNAANSSAGRRANR